MRVARWNRRHGAAATVGLLSLAGALVAAGCSSSGGGSISSCDAFNNASNGAQASAVHNMQQARGDNSSSTVALLSVKAYCIIHPGGNIDGVYSG